MTQRDTDPFSPGAQHRFQHQLRRRHTALRALREWLWTAGFVEADTPQLVPGPGLEPAIDPLVVDVALDLLHTQRARRWLITSPELALKRVVAAGVSRVFQLGHVFRDGEQTVRHSPEFTLLEWYRGPGTLEAILDDTLAMIRVVANAIGNESAVDVYAEPEQLSVAEAFQRYANIDLGAAIDATQAGDVDALPRAVREIGDVILGEHVGFDDAFFHVMTTRIEPHIGRERLCVLQLWPASMAVLARVDDDDPRYARRFEIYGHSQLGCLELCNAFDELTDAVEQRRRFLDDNATRKALGKPELPLDEDFLQALPSMPSPSAGNALGVDRLLMLLSNASSIDDVTSLRWR